MMQSSWILSLSWSNVLFSQQKSSSITDWSISCRGDMTTQLMAVKRDVDVVETKTGHLIWLTVDQCGAIFWPKRMQSPSGVSSWGPPKSSSNITVDVSDPTTERLGKRERVTPLVVDSRTIYEAPETIRGLYGTTDTRNCCHGSGEYLRHWNPTRLFLSSCNLSISYSQDSMENALTEIKFFFPEFDAEAWCKAHLNQSNISIPSSNDTKANFQ